MTRTKRNMETRMTMTMSHFDLKSYMDERASAVEETLRRVLPPEGEFPATIHRAMRYSALAGGKRLRPILFLAAYEACTGAWKEALTPSVAIEFIHTYSLIHDDLPCMDDDDMRRGMPTSHKVFGEAVAVLAGDALQAFGFEVLSRPDVVERFGADKVARAVWEMAAAAGSRGMVGGQVVDIESEGKTLDLDALKRLHSLKTGAIISAAVRCGAIFAGAGEEELGLLTEYSKRLGLAFQITDDVLDAVGNREVLGKTAGKDEAQGKATFVTHMGVAKARAYAMEIADEAASYLSLFGDRGKPLAALARYVVERER